MYAQRLIEQKIRKFTVANGWEPVYHSHGQIQEFSSYITSITKVESSSRRMLFDMKQNLSERRFASIKRFIENEQILCSCDENYWATRYAYICDEKGEISKFIPRQSQLVFHSVAAHFEDLEVAIELLVLKGRQVGISTEVAMKFLHRMLFLPHTQAVMASVQAEKSELIGRI